MSTRLGQCILLADVKSLTKALRKCLSRPTSFTGIHHGQKCHRSSMLGRCMSRFPLDKQKARRPLLNDVSSCRTTKHVRQSHESSTHGPSPGHEATLDSLDYTKRSETHSLGKNCHITIVDYSPETLQKYEIRGDEIIKFTNDRPKDSNVCRWICVDGISLEVLHNLANLHKLHPLAVEDALSPRNRVKADWYPNHMYTVLHLHKLIKQNHTLRMPNTNFQTFINSPDKGPTRYEEHAMESDRGKQVTTLQQWRNSKSPGRVGYMEAASPLSHKHLAVSVEQVSTFLLDDNTIISIFERSAPDVVTSVYNRLQQRGTVLRESVDASLLLYGILDTIVDIAIPITAAYDDALAGLEMQVLARPNTTQPRELYTLSSEINQLRQWSKPVAALIGALRAHGLDPSVRPQAANGTMSRNDAHHQSGSVSISPASRLYLRDVEDHILQIVSAFDGMMDTSRELSSLIFHQLSTRQNESVRQLTVVSVYFLPLTFMTGYFGMNFETMWSVNHSELFFWGIMIPAMAATTFFLRRSMSREKARRLTRRRKTT